MNELKKEMNKMITHQKRTSRSVQFLLYSFIAFTGINSATRSDSEACKILGIATTVLALVNQLGILVDDIKDMIAESDEVEE